MLRVLRQGPEGLEEAQDFTTLARWAAQAETLWVDLEGTKLEELEELARLFHLHPLTIEDCLHGGQRPKLEEYDGYLFLALHALPQTLGDSSLVEEMDELYIYLTPTVLVTVHHREVEAVIKVRGWCRKEPLLLTHNPAFLLHLLGDTVVDQFFPFLDSLEEEIDDLEDAVLTSASRAILSRLFVLKRSLIHLRKSISPLREVFNSLSRRDYAFIDPKNALYFQDVYDHLIRASEIIDASRDLLATTVDAYLSVTSNRLNEVMKRLTVIATIFLPLSFITGFFGMNFEQIPWKDPWLFLLAVLAILAVPVLMLRWFARRGWLKTDPTQAENPEAHKKEKGGS